LVELLVTTAMLALLAAAGFAALSTGTRAAGKADRYGAMIGHGQAALHAMARDLRAAVKHGEFCMTALDAQYDGLDSDTIDFVVARPPKLYPDEDGVTGRCEVGYYIENKRDTEAQWLVRREDGTIDEDPLEGGAISLAGPFVKELDLEFYDGVFWQPGWAYEDEFPKAVRIRIVVVDEDEIERPRTFSTTVPIMAQ